MTNVYEIRWSPVPARAVAISIAALAVPVVAEYLLPGERDYELLVWLLALVPSFLLAYYRGWRGVAVAMAAGMAVISAGQVVLELLDRTVENTPLFLGVLTVFIGVGLGVGWVSELLHRERAKAEWLALTDPLTGLANRRQAVFYLEKEFAAARRGLRPLAVVFFDVDRLKELNDAMGHAAGDRVLTAMGHALARETRDMELSARIGGDEFLSVLEAATAEQARVFVDRVRRRLDEKPSPQPFTFSAGIAFYSAGVSDPDHLLELADRAMFEAKGDGGVVVAPRPGARENSSSA